MSSTKEGRDGRNETSSSARHQQQPEDHENNADNNVKIKEKAAATTTSVSAASIPTPNAAEEKLEETAEEGNKRDPDEAVPFINQGLQLWEQSRTKWLGHKATASSTDERSTISSTNTDTTTNTPRPAAVPIEVDEIIEIVFAMPQQQQQQQQQMAENNRAPSPPRFPRHVPLPQMVDILVDLWEAEGLDI